MIPVLLYHSPLLTSPSRQLAFSLASLGLACICSACSSLQPATGLQALTFLLQPAVHLATCWPTLCTANQLQALPSWLTGETGPFGRGGCKLVEATMVLALGWPHVEFGALPSARAWWLVLAGTAGVALVLQGWSDLTRSRGSHPGVHRLADQRASARRAVSKLREHGALAAFSFGNALCEELVWRGLFLPALATRCGRSDRAPWQGQVRWAAERLLWGPNLCQAVGFGAAHWRGIPSGPLGVGLTFVYGLLMGLLYEWCGGLLLPVVAHAGADYYILAVIARKQYSHDHEG